MRSSIFAFRAALLLAAAVLAASGCGAGKKHVRLLAAQGLSPAFSEIEASFEGQRPGVELELLYASSGTIARQLEAGMPADLFASASEDFMDDLCRQNLVATATRRVIAGNSLVLIRSRDFGGPIGSPEGLLAPGVTKIALGNPGHVPAGRYALQALEKLGLAGKLAPKLVPCDHVRQVLTLVARGEVDAGFTYGTDALSEREQVAIEWEAPPGLHDPILFSMAILAESGASGAPRDFLEFVCGPEGRRILAKHGFAPPPPASGAAEGAK